MLHRMYSKHAHLSVHRTHYVNQSFPTHAVIPDKTKSFKTLGKSILFKVHILSVPELHRSPLISISFPIIIVGIESKTKEATAEAMTSFHKSIKYIKVVSHVIPMYYNMQPSIFLLIFLLFYDFFQCLNDIKICTI